MIIKIKKSANHRWYFNHINQLFDVKRVDSIYRVTSGEHKFKAVYPKDCEHTEKLVNCGFTVMQTQSGQFELYRHARFYCFVHSFEGLKAFEQGLS